MINYMLVAVSSTAVMMLYYIRKRCFKVPTWTGSDVKLYGKTIIITGSNCGIGKDAALDFARRGAKVILACRDIGKAKNAADEMVKRTKNKKISVMFLDLADFASIKKFVQVLKTREKKIDILINNAGVFYLPYSTTKDGFETVFQVNYLGPFLLTLLCIDLLQNATKGQIINVSSHGHRLCDKIEFDNLNLTEPYKKFKVYAQTKAALILFTRTLSQKLKHTNITVNAVNPGNVDTKIYRHFPWLNNPILRAIQWPALKLIFKSSQEGAQYIIHCAVEPTVSNMTGMYFNDFAEEEPSTLTLNPEIAQKLWDQSLKFIGFVDKF